MKKYSKEVLIYGQMSKLLGARVRICLPAGLTKAEYLWDVNG